jgi:hypothetical protein
MSTDVPAPATSRGARNQQVARAGEYFVAAELNKRGAHAVTFAGNMPKIDLMACNQPQDRTVRIQVKTKRGGRTWHASTLAGDPATPPVDSRSETSFWVLVDLGGENACPRYWIVPEWWMRNDIYAAHQAYLAAHGGKRARTGDSTHHAIAEERVQRWYGTWDVLGLWSEPAIAPTTLVV